MGKKADKRAREAATKAAQAAMEGVKQYQPLVLDELKPGYSRTTSFIPKGTRSDFSGLFGYQRAPGAVYANYPAPERGQEGWTGPLKPPPQVAFDPKKPAPPTPPVTTTPALPPASKLPLASERPRGPGAGASMFDKDRPATREDIIATYREILGRDPDEGGLEYYMKLAKDKKWSPYRIATAHLGSDEYKGVLGKDSGKGRGALLRDHSYGRPYDLMDELAHAQSAGNTSFDDIQNAAGLNQLLQQYTSNLPTGNILDDPVYNLGTSTSGGIGNVLSNAGDAARGMVSGAGNIARQGIDALRNKDSDQDKSILSGLLSLLPGRDLAQSIANSPWVRGLFNSLTGNNTDTSDPQDLSGVPNINIPRSVGGLSNFSLPPGFNIPDINIGEEYLNMAGGGYLGQDNFNRVNGQISGRGTETSDNIPAMLSDGEFVFNAKALRGIGSLNGAKNNPEEQRRQGARAMYAFQRAGENALKGGV